MLPVNGHVSASLAQRPGFFVAAQSSTPPATGSQQDTKLRKAAGEFEAILLQSMWKSMKESFSSPDDENSDPTLQSFDELGIQSMASAVGKSGGLGIKNMILKHLEPQIPEAPGGNPAV
jgi:Rod binding domain-containing protein